MCKCCNCDFYRVYKCVDLSHFNDLHTEARCMALGIEGKIILHTGCWSKMVEDEYKKAAITTPSWCPRRKRGYDDMIRAIRG